MKIICGSSNKTLCNGVVALLQDIHQEVKIISTKFSDGESYVELQGEVNDDSVAILQSISSNDLLIELLLLLDILKNLSVKNIVAVIPYFGYSRQDRMAQPYSPISIKLIANILTSLGVTKVITVDLHSKAGERFFTIPLINLSTANIFHNHYKKFYNFSNAVVVAPDIGSKERNNEFAMLVQAKLAVINKNRPSPGFSQIRSIDQVDDIKGKDVIIIDDIVDSAGTLCNSVEFLKDMGAKSVIAYITHAVFSKNAVQKINESKIDHMYITDSIMHKNITSDKISIISIEKLISENI